MIASALQPALIKEVRALLPAWAACVLAVVAAGITQDPRALLVGRLAYGLGSIAIGAQSIGHEYSHRTLGILLAQPADRKRLYLLKFAVLSAMLLVLTAAAWFSLSAPLTVRSNWSIGAPPLIFLAALSGLFVAPPLTMVCRSPLAGMVFTVVVPMSLLVVGDVIGAAQSRYGFGGGAEIDRIKLEVLIWGMFILSALGAVSSWWMFGRLEAIDGRGADVHLPRWPVGSRSGSESLERTARRHSPTWLLVKKELRLQQMTFVIVALCIVGWATLILLERFIPDFPVMPIPALTMPYFGLLAVLIGALASAEERQFGTLEWQLLVPVQARQQWIVKVVVTIGLTLTLGMLLPTLLNVVLRPSGNVSQLTGRAVRESTLLVLLLTIGSLYVSTLNTSGVRAMVYSLPAALAASLFLGTVYSISWDLMAYALEAADVWPRLHRLPPRSFQQAVEWLRIGMAIAVAGILLRYGLRNHRFADRSPGRVWRQAISIAGLLTLGTVLRVGLDVLARIRT